MYAPATRAARAPERFGQGTAAPYGCAGSAAAITSVRSSSSRSRSRSTAPGSANCAEALDEVAAPADAEGLELAELLIDGPVTAGNPFRAHAFARDDAVALEQELGERAWIRLTREERVRGRPPPLRRGYRVGA